MLRNAIAIILSTAGFLSATAQSTSGWYKYPSFTGDIDNLIETSNCVYYRSGTSLFSYSETEEESIAYSTDNYLSGTNVQEIYYNAEKKYLAVAYDDGNIDLLYDNGNYYNLPDIKDANVYASRTINCISFCGDEMFVATDFGFVVFDTNRYEVKYSAVFNEQVRAVSHVGNYIVIWHDYMLKRASDSLNHYKISDFTDILECKMTCNEFYPIAGTSTAALRCNSNFLIILDAETGTANQHTGATFLTPIRPASDGTFYAPFDTGIAVITTEGTFGTDITLPDALQGKNVSYYTSSDNLWANSDSGIAKYSSDGTALTGDIVPPDCINLEKVNLMSWSPDNERLYITRANPSKGRPGSLDGAGYPQTADVIEDMEPRDVSVTECTLTNYWCGTVYQKNNNNKRLYGGNYWIVENPYDEDMYFTSSDWNGVFAIKDGKMVTSFISSNSQYNSIGTRPQGVFIDPENNLWIGMITTDAMPFLQVLPAQYIKPENIESVVKANWVQSPVKGNYGEKNFTMLFSSTCSNAFIHNSNWAGGLTVYDTNGTYADPSDDSAKHYATLTDQDGKSFSPTRFHALAEDKNGQIWCGTTSGVCVITNPENGMSDSFTVRRPKVARNDGTNYADYLLESDAVLWICVDPANNKWLATENSGLYLVNEDGTEILAQYNTTNSPLASNTVYAVEQDPTSNLVYVATDAGFYRFYCSTSPAADDYSEIYAYPNPVRPDYTGWITIKGLTEGSLVKITDAAGNLVAQTTAGGGMAIWDGCNVNGARVRSGVYYVFASSGSGDDQSNGAVTKIIVIN